MDKKIYELNDEIVKTVEKTKEYQHAFHLLMATLSARALMEEEIRVEDLEHVLQRVRSYGILKGKLNLRGEYING